MASGLDLGPLVTERAAEMISCERYKIVFQPLCLGTVLYSILQAPGFLAAPAMDDHNTDPQR